jgi:hypothetical protein
VPRPSPFIVPAQPTLRARPPRGEGWLHEVKFDGYHVQLHKVGTDVVIFSRNGADFTSRWPAIAIALQELAAKRSEGGPHAGGGGTARRSSLLLEARKGAMGDPAGHFERGRRAMLAQAQE